MNYDTRLVAKAVNRNANLLTELFDRVERLEKDNKRYKEIIEGRGTEGKHESN